jgi:hypothetical protein
MAKKPTWKSREVLSPYVEKQGTNRKLHTIRKKGPARSAPDLQLGFTTKGNYEYGQTGNLVFWMQAQKSSAPKDITNNHTVQEKSGTVAHGYPDLITNSGSILTNKTDTPFARWTPKPYRSISRCLAFNTGSGERQFLHVTSSQYITLASGTAGIKNKSMTWNVWIKPSYTGSHTGDKSRYILRKQSGSAGATKREYSLSIDPDAKLVFQLWDESTSRYVLKTTDLKTSGSAIKTGVWQNICVTYSGKTGSYTHQGIKMYRNGILVSSGNAGTTQSGYVATENSGGDLCFGAPYTGSTAAINFFRGKMAEPAIWHTALGEEAVKAIYDARKFFGRMDTKAFDPFRQGVSILTQKHRWRSSNAPKISGISRLSTDEKISHEQDRALFGDAKLFRDDTPFDEMPDAERLRKDIKRTVVGSKASASIEFNGFSPAYLGALATTALVLTGANGTTRTFFFARGHKAWPNNTARMKFKSGSGFIEVQANLTTLQKATGSNDQGAHWATVFTSAVNDQTSNIQMVARRSGNIVKLTSTVTGTAGNTYINARKLNTSNTDTTGSNVRFYHDAFGRYSASLLLTASYDTGSLGSTPGNLGVVALRGGNATMKHVVTQALGGAIDYLQAPGLQQYPVIITNVSMRDPSQFDGNIEPFIIRDTVAWSSIDAPFVAHDIRASLMGGEGSILYGSSQIRQFYDNKNPVSANTNLTMSPAGATAAAKLTEPFIDAQDQLFGLDASTGYAYLKFDKVPHNRDKIILTDTAGRMVAFEFVNSTSINTGTLGKTRNKPSKQGGSADGLPGFSGRGTWRVLLTGSPGGETHTTGLRTGSTDISQVAKAMSHFRNEVAHAFNNSRLFITCSDRRYTETHYDSETGLRVGATSYSTTSGSRTYVRLDQTISGSDGNRRIDFRFRGFSTGTYILNGLTASAVYRSLITQFSTATTFRNLSTRIKFIRQKAKKMGMSFVSGTNTFNLPVDGFISEVEKKIDPYSDIKKLSMKKGSGSISSLLTSTMDGTREWNELGHGYKSSGAGFTYNNDHFGTDSITFGGKKR